MADLELMRRLGAIGVLSETEIEAVRGYREGRDEPLVSLESTAPEYDDTFIAELISPESRRFVIEKEVTSRAHYEARLFRPEWPKGDSGITVGIGYDIGYNTEAQVRRHWAGLLAPADIDLMVKACGKRGQTAGGMLAMFNAIRVPWDVALQVFDRSTIPEHGRKTLGAFPNAKELKGHAFGALFSLVYNRGAGMGDSATGSRKEMREIRDAVQRKDYKAVPQLIRDMKRLWKDKESMRGLLVRRDEEALMFERGLEVIAHAAAAIQVASLESVALPEPDLATRDGDGRFWRETPEGATVLEANTSDWDKVSWAKDPDSPDYSHLQDPTLIGKSFDFGADEFELLIEQNSFAPDRNYHRIIFALRGTELVTGGAKPATMTKQEDRDALTLRDARPDHHDFHCVIGVYNTLTRRLSGYTSSTVPNRKAVSLYFEKKQTGNMMPTGCYRLEIGWHHESQADRKIPGCLIENGRQKAVLRSTNDRTYDLRDTWEDDHLHGDNLHPATSDRPDTFSSYGCLVVNGSYTAGPNNDREHGTHNGEWALFRQALGLAKSGTSDHAKEFDVVLLTGLEAAIARDVLTKGPNDQASVRKRLGRLRQGSTGERVAKLRRGLKIPADKGPATTLDHKLAKALADRQKQDFNVGDGVYSPKMEEHYRFGVFDDNAVVASLESVGESDGTVLHAMRNDSGAQLQSLYYEMGLYAAAADNDGQPVQDAALESLGAAQIAYGVNWIKAKGLVVAQELERQMKGYICGRANNALLTHGAAISGQLDAAAGRGADAFKNLLVRLLVGKILVLPETSIRSFVDYVVDQMVVPAATAAGAVIAGQFKIDTGSMCQGWQNHSFVATLAGPATAAAAPALADPTQPSTLLAPPASPRRELAALINRVDAVTRGDPVGFASVRGTYADLRQYLTRNGEHLEPVEVEQVLATICDTKILDPLSASGGVDPGALVDDLIAAAKDGVHGATARDKIDKILAGLQDALADPRVPIQPKRAESALAVLRKNLLFDQLTKLADKFLSRDPSLIGAISQPYAQGLIDSGRVLAGLDVLQNAIASNTLSKPEVDKAYGSLGRGYKQIYVDHVRTPADASALRDKFGPQLQKAIESYASVYDRNQPGENYWHGINLIALRFRRERDGIREVRNGNPVDESAETRQLTQEMLAALLKKEPGERTGPEYHWLLASIGEAYLALGNTAKAAEFMALYAQEKSTDAFALAGTIRQLEEVWQIRAGASGAGAILANLKAALATREGGSINLMADERHAIANATRVEFQERFESLTTDGKFTQFATLKQIVTCGSAVCAVQKATGELSSTIGTGFLVHGPDFSDRLPADKSYVLTNAHVLWDPAKEGPGRDGSLAPADAHIIFETELIDGKRNVYRCARVLWQSSFEQHDATLFELDRKVERIAPLLLAPRDAPLAIALDGNTTGTRLAVVGHPKGGNLAVSMRGSIDEKGATLVDRGNKGANSDIVFLHYKTPTEGGNSGSPVFEVDNWRVVALHHAGYPKDSPGLKRLSPPDGFNLANEGIWIECIRIAARAKLATLPMPDTPKPQRKGWFG